MAALQDPLGFQPLADTSDAEAAPHFLPGNQLSLDLGGINTKNMMRPVEWASNFQEDDYFEEWDLESEKGRKLVLHAHLHAPGALYLRVQPALSTLPLLARYSMVLQARCLLASILRPEQGCSSICAPALFTYWGPVIQRESSTGLCDHSLEQCDDHRDKVYGHQVGRCPPKSALFWATSAPEPIQNGRTIINGLYS